MGRKLQKIHCSASGKLRLNHFLLVFCAFEPLPQCVNEGDEPKGDAYPAQYEPDDVAEQVIRYLEADEGDKR